MFIRKRINWRWKFTVSVSSFPGSSNTRWRNQVRASSKSIPVNIAEGMGKQESPAEVKRFVRIAIGSCDETRVWLEFARDLGYLDIPQHKALEERYQEVGRMLQGLIKRYDG